MSSMEEQVRLRDQHRWDADKELRVNGPTEKFRQLARSYHTISGKVGYPEDVR